MPPVTLGVVQTLWKRAARRRADPSPDRLTAPGLAELCAPQPQTHMFQPGLPVSQNGTVFAHRALNEVIELKRGL